MLDIRRLRTEMEEVKSRLKLRSGEYDVDSVLALDENRREILQKVEQMKNQQKLVSKDVPRLKKEGLDVEAIFEEMRKLGDEIKVLDEEVSVIDEEIKNRLLNIPNTPHNSTPMGETDADNRLYRTWGSPKAFGFEPKAHWDIGADQDILDFERASKISGARFTILKGQGARMERAIINFMLNLHTDEHGYTEIFPPLMVNRDAMTGTGQLPKFEDDMFLVPAKDFFLIPTAEVPVTNMYMNEILEESMLPIYHTAFTPCFRKEAGSAGRDTRGLIRQHQFNKVELVKFTKPENSYEELESLLLAAEEVLKRLELPYRVVQLCGGDLGFSSAKTYDIEVWMPSYNRYLEISSCSNFEDYQARRANIRYREGESKKVQHIHTLNGSGLAVGRTLAAILENYQNADGSVTIPEVLRPYMGGAEKIG